MRYRLGATLTLVMMLLVAAVGLVAKGPAAAGAGLTADTGQSLSLLPFISDGTPPMLEPVSWVGGDGSSKVVVRGNYAYINEGQHLLMLNVANPAAAKADGKSPSLGMEFADLAVAGNTAFVVGEIGLRTVDVSNPAAPTPVGAITAHGRPWGVAAVNDIAYLATDEGLVILNVANPAAPAELGFYPTAGAKKVTVAGTTAYLSAGGTLWILDVANPAQPNRVGSFDIPPGESTNVFASGSTIVGSVLYLTGIHSGLHILDVANPAAPRQIGFYGYSDWAGEGNGHYLCTFTGACLDRLNLNR